MTCCENCTKELKRLKEENTLLKKRLARSDALREILKEELSNAKTDL